MPTETFTPPTENWGELNDGGFVTPAESWKSLETESDFIPLVDDWRSDEFQTRDGFVPPTENWEDFILSEPDPTIPLPEPESFPSAPEALEPELAEEVTAPELISSNDAEKIKRRQAVERRRDWDNTRADRRITDIELPETEGAAEEKAAAGLTKWVENFDWKVLAKGGVSLAAGFGLGELMKFGPGGEVVLSAALVGINRALSIFGGAEGVQRFIDRRKNMYPKFYRSVLGKVAEVELKAIKMLASPEVVFLAMGLLGHSVYEAVSGQESVFEKANFGEHNPAEMPETEIGRGVRQSARPVAGMAGGDYGLGSEFKHEFGISGGTGGGVGGATGTVVENWGPGVQHGGGGFTPELWQGKTVGEMAQQLHGLPTDALGEIIRGIGITDHAGEVRQVLITACQAGGVDINSLTVNQVQSVVVKLAEMFNQAGVETAKAPGGEYILRNILTNSTNNSLFGAQGEGTMAFRAANIAGDMDAGRSIFEALIKPMLR